MTISAMNQSFVPLARAKTYLKEARLDVEKSELVQLHINAISAYILAISGQSSLVWQDSWIEEYRDGDGSDSLYLRSRPVREIDSVTFYPGRDYEEIYTGPGTAVSNTEILVNQRTGELMLLLRAMPTLMMGVMVKYKAGWYLPDQPNDGDAGDPEGHLLQTVTLNVLQRRWSNMIQNTVGIASRSTTEGESVTYSKEDFTEEELKMLKRFQGALLV